jgi:hypothetical protein
MNLRQRPAQSTFESTPDKNSDQRQRLGERFSDAQDDNGKHDHIVHRFRSIAERLGFISLGAVVFQVNLPFILLGTHNRINQWTGFYSVLLHSPLVLRFA